MNGVRTHQRDPGRHGRQGRAGRAKVTASRSRHRLIESLTRVLTARTRYGTAGVAVAGAHATRGGGPGCAAPPATPDGAAARSRRPRACSLGGVILVEAGNERVMSPFGRALGQLNGRQEIRCKLEEARTALKEEHAVTLSCRTDADGGTNADGGRAQAERVVSGWACARLCRPVQALEFRQVELCRMIAVWIVCNTACWIPLSGSLAL
mgnify:CR=1 FL=1